MRFAPPVGRVGPSVPAIPAEGAVAWACVPPAVACSTAAPRPAVRKRKLAATAMADHILRLDPKICLGGERSHQSSVSEIVTILFFAMFVTVRPLIDIAYSYRRISR